MPNSVLWVCLVAVWLFVLVPMVLKGRPQMRKTTDAVKATRLLHRGGTQTRTARRRASGAHPHDPSWKSERSKRSTRTRTATAVLDDEKDTTAPDSDAETTKTTSKMRRATDATVEAPTVDADSHTDDSVDEIDSADIESADTDTDIDTDEDTITVDGEFVDPEPDAESDESADVVDAELETEDEADDEADLDEGDLEDEDDSELVDEDEEFEDEDEYDDEVDEYEDDLEDDLEEDLDDDYEDFDDEDEDDFEEEPAVAQHRDETPAEPAPAAAEERPEPPRRRRTAYSPDAKRAEMKYRERQRVLIGLVVLVIAAIASGIFLGATGWILTAVSALMLIGYLAYLRRATATEQRIRAQRAARARRARHDEDERRRRAAAVPEFAAAPPPPRLRRPGGSTVLEIDDEDPIFDHLPPYQHRRIMREDQPHRRAG